MNYKLLLFMLLLGMAVTPLRAAGDPTNGYCGRKVNFNVDSTNLSWSIDFTQHKLLITGSGRMKDYDNDTKAPWYPWRDSIYTVSFPNGMTTVGSMAMYYLTKLESINWGGNTVTHIYNQAFYYCSSLTSLSLPSTVEYIGWEAYRACSSLTDIQWSSSLQTIDWYAFLSCSNLTILNFPNSLQSIGNSAFQSCSNLTKVTFGNNVQTIGSFAFTGCSKITEIDFGKSPVTIEMYVFRPATSLVTIKAKNIRNIGLEAFAQCGQLVNLQLGDSLQTIADYAFDGCSSLRAIHFPATISSFTPLAFRYCYSLDTITVHPDNPKYDSRNNGNAVFLTANNTLHFGCRKSVIPSETQTIGSYAFYYCKGLPSVSLPVGLQSIQDFAFSSCDSLETVVLPEGLQSLGEHAFSECSNLTSVNLPNSVTSINCGVFYKCNKITTPIYNTTYFVYLPTNHAGSYTIPGTPKKIACEAFEDCKQLTSVVIPSSVTDVNGSAFKNCEVLQNAPLPNNLTFLGSSAFQGCSSLASINIPERIKTIEGYTFEGCSSLLSIVIPDSVTTIGISAFENCSSLASMTFPADLKSLWGGVITGCTSLHDIVWNVRTYNTIDVFAYRQDLYDPFYRMRSQITSFAFGDSVRVIPENLCYEMSQLTSLSFGANLETIGNNAFYGCNMIDSVHWNVRRFQDPLFYTKAPFYNLRNNIKAFTFGDSVRYIPSYLCHSMSRLHQLHFPKNVSSIGRFAFRYVNQLDSISVDEDNEYYDSRNNCNALIETGTDVLLLGCYKTRMPDDITGVGECAFHNVRELYSVALPEDVTFVGAEAFNGCRDLKQLTLPNTIERIEDYAFQNCDSLPVLDLPAALATVGYRSFAHCSALEAINCSAATPPVIDETSFSDTNCPFYVPCAYIASYRNAPVWGGFGNRLAGEALYSLQVSPNEFSYGVASILQRPDCEHTAIIEATPSRGYRFVAWTDEAGNEFATDAHYEFPLEEDMSLIAVFERINQDIEAIQEENTAIWYDIMGHRVAAPSHGVYIVVTGSEAHKVVIP